METNKIIADMIVGMKDEIMKAVMEALASAPAPQPQPKKKFYGKTSDYQPEQGELNVLEYSESTTAVYGDLKDKTELLDIIKAFGNATIVNDKGNAREYRATFMRSLQSIELADASLHPCGWLLNNKALDANGGVKALVDSLSEAGATVCQRESVASITAARKADKADKAEEPKAPTAPAPQTTKSKPQTKIVNIAQKVKDAVCYEPIKYDPCFRVERRELAKTQDFYTLQTSKGVMCYIVAGEDEETNETIYLLVDKCDSMTDALASSLNAMAKSSLEQLIKDDKIKQFALSPAMNAFARMNNEEMVDFIWEKVKPAS